MEKRILSVWGFLTIIEIILSLSLAPLVASVAGNASTSKEFFTLLARPGITTIYLLNDVTLDLEDAPDRPVNLTSDLTIAAGLPEPQATSLAANYIASKIRLAPYITLTFERIILSGILRGTGQHLDLLTRSDGGAVIYNRTTNHRTACLPFDLFYKQLQSLPPPLEEAGVPVNASRDFWLRDGTYCWLDMRARNVCMTPYLDMVSYGTYNSKIDGVIGNGGYNSFFVNSYGVCDKEISEDCIRQRGADLCLAAALAAAASGDSAVNGGTASNTALAVGLGVGLGGALLLAVVLVAVFARFHFQHRREAATATASHSSRSKAGLSAGSQGILGGTELTDPETASGDAASQPPASSTWKPAGPGGAAGGEAEPRLAADSTAHDGGGVGGDGGGKGRLTALTTGGSTGGTGSSSNSGISSGVTVEASSATVAQRAAAGAGEGSGGAGLGEVEAARLNLLANAARGRAGRGAPLDVKVLQLLGQGSFGKVYKGIWHGTLVALKAQVLPPSLSGDARRRHMAVMEAAISSAINHPSIVQTYCYSFRPIKDTVSRTVVKHKGNTKSRPILEEAGGVGGADDGGGCDGADCESGQEDGGDEDYGHELLLVLEYCDGGSLRAALDKGVFHRGRPWPWDWRRAIQAAGQAAVADGLLGGGRQQSGRPPSQQNQQYQAAAAAAVAAAAAAQPQGDSTAIANLVAAMTRGGQYAPLSAADSSPSKRSGVSSAAGTGGAPAAAAAALPSPPPAAAAAAAGAAAAGAGPAGTATPPRGASAAVPARKVGVSGTVEASELGSSLWPKLDTYEPDFTHGAFEVVLQTADDTADAAAAAATGGGGAAEADAHAAAATTLNVFNTLAGAPTAAMSLVTSCSNALGGAGASAADNAAAAAAADRLAMMYLLQQAAAAVAAGADPAVGGHAKALADYISSSNLTGLNTSALAAELESSGLVAAPPAPEAAAAASISSDDTLVAPPPAVLVAPAAAAAAAPTAARSGAVSGCSTLRSQVSLRRLASSGVASTAEAAGSGGASALQPQPAIRYELMLAVAADVASGLLHLHLHGVVHGDVKASNVLLKQIVVSDPLEGAGRAMDAMSGGNGPLSAGPSMTAAAGSAAGLGVGSVAGGGSAPAAASAAADLLRAVSESTDRSPRLGLCAKVSDFGLSTMLSASNTDTHISATTAAGSLSHMSPELLLCGHVSKANDVYAYGILLFELFTGERAWEGMPRALLPARVALEGWRPVFPPHTPAPYRQLAERCWLADPARRPTFEEILSLLKDMREAAAAEAQQEWVAVANPQMAFLQQLMLQRRPAGAPGSPSAAAVGFCRGRNAQRRCSGDTATADHRDHQPPTVNHQSPRRCRTCRIIARHLRAVCGTAACMMAVCPIDPNSRRSPNWDCLWEGRYKRISRFRSRGGKGWAGGL